LGQVPKVGRAPGGSFPGLFAQQPEPGLMANFSDSDELYLLLVGIAEEDSTVAQAQGMLMDRFDVLPEEALDLLAMAAQLDGVSTYETQACNLVTSRHWYS
jgi:hypothetical protein